MTEAWKTWEGQAVDGFPLRQYLGGSGRSAVYLTELGNSGGQSAAIKFIPSSAAADAQLARWRVAGELNHPHILQLIRVGRCQFANADFLYVVMEYAEENLAEIFPQRALEPDETRGVVDAVLNALEYLHGQGLAHTRIKPSNIMAVGDQLKISSDTLCEIGSAPLAMPETSVYAAPESAAAPIAPAADVWSLGIAVVQALTQRTPTVKNQARTELPVPETIPPPFLEIARRSVQLDPARRASLKEIAALLNPSQTPHRQIPMALPVAEPVVVEAKPEKKSLASQQVSVTPHTLFGNAPTRAAAKPAPRKSRMAIPILAASIVLAAILLAPRMLNRFSQLQPHADTVQPTIEPASSALTPPAETAGAEKPTKQAPLGPAAPTRAENRLEKRGSEKVTAKENSSALPRGNITAGEGSERPRDKSAKATEPRAGNNSEGNVPSGSTPAKAATSNAARGAVLYQVVPDVSQRARDTILGKVRVDVKLKVDAAGNVVNADLVNDDGSRYFADRAVQVAQRWLFTPPEVDGRAVPSEWLLRFEFSPTTTKVFPTQTSP
jgi:TonB family protein